jgi:ubiquinone/menaquinone biosynthesis C-methylase UbiE
MIEGDDSMEEEEKRKIVKDRYAEIARESSSCCAPTSCCGPSPADAISQKIGYSGEELESLPEGANLGLGCGNPTALASIKEGETVVDLGSGPGLDCFLAAKKVGPKGHVIGIDMTPEMLAKAWENAAKGGYENVEFRKGLIEELPVDDSTVDLIISNCVINLSPEKQKVFDEAYRILKPGGRIMVSDIVLLQHLPEKVRDNANAYSACIAGAVLKDEYLGHLKTAGFNDIEILAESNWSLDEYFNEISLKNITEQFGLTPEQIKGLGSTVQSTTRRARSWPRHCSGITMTTSTRPSAPGPSQSASSPRRSRSWRR